MTAISINAFRGEVPRIGARLLQNNQASRATNIKLTSGRLDPLRGLALTHTSLAQSIKTAYRYRHAPPGVQPVEQWLVWGQDVNVVASLIPDDAQSRFYFTSDDFEPRISTYGAAIDGGGPYPDAWFALGVTSPTTAPSASVTGGTGANETRAYVYTLVTSLGEESGPSPAVLVTGFINGTWSLSGLQVEPSNSGTITGALPNTPAGGFVTVTFDTAYGMAAYDTLTLADVAGMTSLNGARRPVSVSGNTAVFELETSETYTSGGTWARGAPHNTASMVKRIYRTAATAPDYFFVAEIPAADATYDDTIAGTALGELIQTKETLPPPKNLSSLIGLPNGCLVGVAGNELCFSDPYMPYSWPIASRYTFASKGVALVAAGNSVILLTDGAPLLYVGSDPQAMAPSTMQTYAPCVSKRGVVNVGGGAIYPSYDGLWLITSGNVEKITQNLYRLDEWSALHPETFDAAFQDGKYHAVHRTIAAPDGRILVLDVAERDSVSYVDDSADHLLRNDYDGLLYVSKGNLIYVWDAGDANRYACDWISKTYQLGKPTNFAVAQVYAEFAQIIPPNTTVIEANTLLISQGADAVAGHLNGAEILSMEINGSYIDPAPLDVTRFVQFTLYADGAPVFSRSLTDNRPFRLPAGYLSEIFNIGINASVPTYSIAVAESTAELAQAPV